MNPAPKPLEYGCPACNFWTAPSTLPTNYRECPLCRGPIVSRDPKPPKGKGKRAADSSRSLMPD